MGFKTMALIAITVCLVVWAGGGAVASAAEAAAPRVIPEVLSLEKAVALAVSNHPSLRVSSGTQAINEALVGQALAPLYPQVSGQQAYTRTTANATRNFTGSPLPRNNTGDAYSYFQNGVTMNQLLYDFGTTKAGVEYARQNLDAANANAQTTLQTVVVNVQQAYFTLQQTQRLVTVNEEAILQFQKHLDLAKGRFKAGVAPKVDVTTAEVDLSNARLNLITAQNNLLVARVTLNNAMGIKTAEAYHAEEPTPPSSEHIALEEALKAAMRLRPEMIAQRAQEKSAQTNIQVQQGGFWPNLTSSANYSYSATDFPLTYNWSVGATFSIPIFNGFLTQQQIAQARANLLTTIATGEVLWQSILLEVNQALLNLEAAQERLKVTAVTVVQATQLLQQVEGRYKAGLSNAVEVTDSEVTLVTAQTNDVVAMSNYQAARAALDKAMGIITPLKGN